MAEVSMIIAAGRRVPEVVATIQSLTRQTLADVEILVVQDGSAAEDIAEGVGAIPDDRILLLRSQPQTPGKAASRRAYGTIFATSPFIGFSEDDCSFASNYLASLMHGLMDPQVDVAYCDGVVEGNLFQQEPSKLGMLGPGALYRATSLSRLPRLRSEPMHPASGRLMSRYVREVLYICHSRPPISPGNQHAY